MRERGISFRHNQIYFTSTSAKCPSEISSYGQELELYDVATAYFILLGGYGLSFLSALLETRAVHCHNWIRKSAH